MKIIRKFIVFFAALLLVFLALNWSYFSKYISYEFKRSEPVKEFSSNNFDPNYLSIPSLGISAPIVYPEQDSEEEFQEALQLGVAHYPGTAKPGERGNMYVFGHSSDYPWASGSYKTVFALLPEIKAGDRIIITDSQDVAYVYECFETKIIDSDDFDYLAQDYQERMLTLQTSYPLGTALKRFIVRARLLEF